MWPGSNGSLWPLIKLHPARAPRRCSNSMPRLPPSARAHAAQLAGNVLPHDWKAGEEGYTEEEWKMIRETKKIMGDDTIEVSPTTARVPVRIGHSEAINLEFERPIS